MFMKTAVPVSALVAYGALARPWMTRWGATAEEVQMDLPGDDVVAHPDVTATRAITVNASTADVWPWLAQLGQGRGGFYSYERLENLVGADIHNADRIVPQWQSVEVGAEVRLAPEVVLTAAVVEPGRSLVLRGGVPMGRVPAPYDFTWAFVLRAGRDGSTRLVVRERYGYLRWWAPAIVRPVEVISFVMSLRMLHGIKRRAQRAVVSAAPGRTR
ncbi:MAG: hypothetical protein JWR88_1126 [Pseudonocardia sp.]|jgi:hypothetical protein|nr:hypothetical protein [Pseudonocardia sp.]